MIQTTPNSTIEALQEASLVSTAAFNKHFRLEADLLRDKQIEIPSLKNEIVLNSKATFVGDLLDLEPYLESDAIVDRLVGAFKVHRQATADRKSPAGTHDAILTKASAAFTSVISEYPMLLESGFSVRLQKRGVSYGITELFKYAPGFLLPSRLNGFTDEGILAFAKHRSVAAQLRVNKSNTSLYFLELVNPSASPNAGVLFNIIELSQALLRSSSTRERTSSGFTSLVLADPQSTLMVAKQFGGHLAAALRTRGTKTGLIERQTLVEEGIRLLQSPEMKVIVGNHVLQGLGDEFGRELKNLQAGSDAGGRLIQTLTQLGIAGGPVEAAWMAMDLVTFDSICGANADLVAAADPDTVIGFVEEAWAAAGVAAPWRELVERVDREATKLYGLRPIVAAETALRSKAHADLMHSRISQLDATPSGQDQDPLDTQPRAELAGRRRRMGL